jgi:prepilin-type processing-associated H-X9-DG protein
MQVLILALAMCVPLQNTKAEVLRPVAPQGYVYTSYDWYQGGAGNILWSDGHYRSENGKRVD